MSKKKKKFTMHPAKRYFKTGLTVVVTNNDDSMTAIFPSVDGNELVSRPFRDRYVKWGKFSIPKVLSKTTSKTGEEEMEFDGHMVKMDSTRYLCFDHKGICCSSCGMKATHFTLERHVSHTRFHFNLYGLDENGKEVMFTKDHIIPKSKGGSDHLENMQTMCEKCNFEKQNNFTDEDIKNGKMKIGEKTCS